jgi:hypothetical protein
VPAPDDPVTMSIATQGGGGGGRSLLWKPWQTPHLDAEIEAARVEILEAQANRRVTLRGKEL